MKNKYVIRLATAEDFYEDFGNSLTRIQVLSEILERKILPADTEGKQLIGQITGCLSALWLGFRDMLWAMSHTEHTTGELLTRLTCIGREIFKDHPGTVFLTDNKILKPDYILPPQYCLNILIIFKELMLACSEFPDASFIRMKIEQRSGAELTIRFLMTAGPALRQLLEKKLDLTHIEKSARRMEGRFTMDDSADEVIVCRLAVAISRAKSNFHPI